jgi:hypothetical protein
MPSGTSRWYRFDVFVDAISRRGQHFARRVIMMLQLYLPFMPGTTRLALGDVFVCIRKAVQHF